MEEFEAKPMKVSNEEQFNKYAEELLENWTKFSMLKKRMDVLNSTCKKYMEDNDIDVHKTPKGKLILTEQGRNQLNRAKIENIEQYYEITKVRIMFKQPKE